ncbi:endonuclease-reverse transcriptase, partial [Schistosoma japonicum]
CWKKARGGQTITWHQSMKTLTIGLSHVNRCRLPGWGPRDDRNKWLETLARELTKLLNLQARCRYVCFTFYVTTHVLDLITRYNYTLRRTLPRCGRPRSDNHPHTSNSTQDHIVRDQTRDPLVDIEYADDIVLFGEDADNVQSLLNTLSNNASIFEMRFSSSKCEMLLQDWPASSPELMIGSEVIEW